MKYMIWIEILFMKNKSERLNRQELEVLIKPADVQRLVDNLGFTEKIFSWIDFVWSDPIKNKIIDTVVEIKRLEISFLDFQAMLKEDEKTNKEALHALVISFTTSSTLMIKEIVWTHYEEDWMNDLCEIINQIWDFVYIPDLSSERYPDVLVRFDSTARKLKEKWYKKDNCIILINQIYNSVKQGEQKRMYF